MADIPHPIAALLPQAPIPILPAHGSWVKTYWRAWALALEGRGILPGPDTPQAGIDPVVVTRPSALPYPKSENTEPGSHSLAPGHLLATARRLRASGQEDAARDLAAGYLDRADAVPLDAAYAASPSLFGGSGRPRSTVALAPSTLAPPLQGHHWPELALLLLELIIGIQAEAFDVDAAQATVFWHLRESPPVGIANLHLGENIISLLAETDSGEGIRVVVEVTPHSPGAQAGFDLQIDTGLTTFSEHVPAGRTAYLLTYLDRTDIRKL